MRSRVRSVLSVLLAAGLSILASGAATSSAQASGPQVEFQITDEPGA